MDAETDEKDSVHSFGISGLTVQEAPEDTDSINMDVRGEPEKPKESRHSIPTGTRTSEEISSEVEKFFRGPI